MADDYLEFKTAETKMTKTQLEDWIFDKEKQCRGKIIAIGSRTSPPETGIRVTINTGIPAKPPKISVTSPAGPALPPGTTVFAEGNAYVSGNNVKVVVYR